MAEKPANLISLYSFTELRDEQTQILTHLLTHNSLNLVFIYLALFLYLKHGNEARCTLYFIYT